MQWKMLQTQPVSHFRSYAFKQKGLQLLNLNMVQLQYFSTFNMCLNCIVDWCSVNKMYSIYQADLIILNNILVSIKPIC